MPVSLTFDDGPERGSTEKILDALQANDVPATFFVQGRYVEAEQAVVEAILSRGHHIHPHCWDHNSHRVLSPDQIEADLTKTLEVLTRFEISPRFWRPPFGHVRRGTPDEVGTCQIAEQYGLSVTGWTLNTEDYERDSTADSIMALIRQGKQPYFGPVDSDSVILLHDAARESDRQTCANTIDAIPHIVESVARQGWAFGRLDHAVKNHLDCKAGVAS
jgi:peptidoglycan-N-acetylglucosamine deacetylase